jgi:hypothetical protein
MPLAVHSVDYLRPNARRTHEPATIEGGRYNYVITFLLAFIALVIAVAAWHRQPLRQFC